MIISQPILETILIKMLYLQNSNNFVQILLRDKLHIPENELSRIKTNFRNACKKYCNVRCDILYRYRGQNYFKTRQIKRGSTNR